MAGLMPAGRIRSWALMILVVSLGLAALPHGGANANAITGWTNGDACDHVALVPGARIMPDAMAERGDLEAAHGLHANCIAFILPEAWLSHPPGADTWAVDRPDQPDGLSPRPAVRPPIPVA